MKIHRTKMGCLKLLEQRSQSQTVRKADEEDQGQDTHHSAQDLPAAQRQAPGNIDSRPRIKWPKMCDEAAWKALDEDLTAVLEGGLRGNIESRLNSFGALAYEYCLERFGAEEKRTAERKQANRRQLQKARLRTELRSVKARWKQAPQEEKPGLEVLMQELRKRIQTLSKAEYERKKRREKRRRRENFLKNPFGFTKSLFEQSKSGTLKASQEELEEHLRKTYSDPRQDDPLPEVDGLIRPDAPLQEFDLSDLKWSEVRECAQKARAKSAPGVNGLSYKLLKKCPNVLKVLWRLLRVAWKKLVVSPSWCIADGVYIPKEADSQLLGQFRPISLLNIEGKIFFAVLARRITSFALQNKYINTSVQKAGIPGFPGCLEHATMIWSAIQQAKKEKKDLHVVWLDLANAYGSVPHKVIQKAMEFFYIPECIQKLLMRYYSKFHMRFTTKEYVTGWQPLEVGIPMGCTISPLLFVLAMEMIVRGAESTAAGTELPGGQVLPPMKAFMDDITSLIRGKQDTEALLQRLDELIKWARMAFKPKKSRSLSLVKGRAAQTRFHIAGEQIPTLQEQPVKSLGRWYSHPLTDKHRGSEVQQLVTEGLQAIDNCGLPGKFKVWCFQFGLLPRILWPMQVYTITMTRVETMERKVSSYLRKWLGVPRSLTSGALYCSTSKLTLPTTALTEEYKVAKARIYLMMRDSKDPVVKQAKPEVSSGRKWKVAEAVEQAESRLRLKEIVGATQQDRRGLGWKETRWWSKRSEEGRREMVTAELRQMAEEERQVKAVGQPQQGASTTWEGTDSRNISWTTLKTMQPTRISMLLRSVYDLLPTPTNLRRWKESESDKCSLCGKRGTLEHVLSGCSASLLKYTWRHNQVLKVIADAVDKQCKTPSQQMQDQDIHFVGEGHRPVKTTARRTVPPLVSNQAAWQMQVDLGPPLIFPGHIASTRLRPDMVVWADSKKVVLIVELTVPWEANMEWAHERKATKYSDLKVECEEGGWTCQVFPVEVGCRGFVGKSLIKLLTTLGIPSRTRQTTIKKAQEAAENASAWIWHSRQ